MNGITQENEKLMLTSPNSLVQGLGQVLKVNGYAEVLMGQGLIGGPWNLVITVRIFLDNRSFASERVPVF